jgi:hypothetical protein
MKWRFARQRFGSTNTKNNTIIPLDFAPFTCVVQVYKSKNETRFCIFTAHKNTTLFSGLYRGDPDLISHHAQQVTIIPVVLNRCAATPKCAEEYIQVCS